LLSSPQTLRPGVMIRGILFDAAGVFYDRPQSTKKYVAGLLHEMGLSAELPAKDRVRQKALRSQANRGHFGPSEYWDQILLMLGVDSPAEREALVAKVGAYSDQIRATPGGREAMAALKQRGFVLGIVTDTIYPIGRKMRWLNQVGVAEFIDVVACSTVVGAHKPDPAIYLDALQQAHLRPYEAAFVGHATDELEGARSAGLVTVAVFYEPGARADYYAESLLDLLNVPIFERAHP
jgi:HAD superfamily hydrolase (TIGR01509 family)